MRHDALVSNPVDRVDFSANRATGDRESFEPHPLTPEQIADVCAALRGERPGRDGKPLPAYPVYAPMVEFAAYTGLRASVLAGWKSPTSCLLRHRLTRRSTASYVSSAPRPRRRDRLGDWHAEVEALPAYGAAAGLAGCKYGLTTWQSIREPVSRMRRCGRAEPTRPREPVEPPTPGARRWTGRSRWSWARFYRYAFNRAVAAVGLPVTAPGRPARTRRDGTTKPARPRRPAPRPPSFRGCGVAEGRAVGGAGVAVAGSRAADDHAQRVWQLSARRRTVRCQSRWPAASLCRYAAEAARRGHISYGSMPMCGIASETKLG